MASRITARPHVPRWHWQRQVEPSSASSGELAGTQSLSDASLIGDANLPEITVTRSVGTKRNDTNKRTADKMNKSIDCKVTGKSCKMEEILIDGAMRPLTSPHHSARAHHFLIQPTLVSASYDPHRNRADDFVARPRRPHLFD